MENYSLSNLIKFGQSKNVKRFIFYYSNSSEFKGKLEIGNNSAADT
jgi:hypothetical protein